MRSAARFLGLALFVFVADQATKALMVDKLAGGVYIPIAGRVLGLRLAANTGAAFSMFSSSRPLLIALTVIAIAAILYYARHAEGIHPWMLPALGLQLGGALGNLADRVRLGHVTDFIYVSFWPTFNVADVALTLGVALLSYCILAAPAPDEEQRARGDSSAAAEES